MHHYTGLGHGSDFHQHKVWHLVCVASIEGLRVPETSPSSKIPVASMDPPGWAEAKSQGVAAAGWEARLSDPLEHLALYAPCLQEQPLGLTLHSRIMLWIQVNRLKVAPLNLAFQGFWPQEQITAVAWASLEVWIIFPPKEAILSFIIADSHVVFHRMSKEYDLHFAQMEICWCCGSSVLHNLAWWFLTQVVPHIHWGELLWNANPGGNIQKLHIL